MATNNDGPKTLAERAKGIDEKRKAHDEYANERWGHLSNASAAPNNKSTQTKPTQTTAEKPVEKRGDSSEERETALYLMQLNQNLRGNAFNSQMGQIQKTREKISDNVGQKAIEIKTQLDKQAYDPITVDTAKIMQQNITQRAAEKMAEDPTSVEGVEDKREDMAKVLSGYRPFILNPDIQKAMKMRSAFDATDPLYESQGLSAAFKYLDTLPTNEDGKIVVDGVPYTRMELAYGLAPQIVAENSNSLWANNANYRNDWATRLGYKNMDSYLEALDKTLENLQNELADETWKDYDRYASPYSEASQIQFGLVNNEASGAKVIRDIRDQISSLRKDPSAWGDFVSGLKEGFDIGNFMSFGVTDLVSEATKLSLYAKMRNGEGLTRKEEILRDVLEIGDQITSLQDAQGTSWLHSIGKGVGFTAEMAPQLIGPMAVSKALFTPVNLGVKGLWHLVKKSAIKGGFTSAVKTGLAGTAKVGYKALKNIGRFQVAGMVTSPLQATTYTRFLEKRNAQYSLENGQLVYKPTDAWKDFVDTLVEQGAETGSELFGVSLDKFMSTSLITIGENIGLGKFLRKIGGSIGDVELPKAARFVKAGATKAGQQLLGYAGGIVPESLSEIYGDITGEMFKSVLTGNGSLEELKDPSYWATAFAISGIYGGGMTFIPGAIDYATYMKDLATLGKKKRAILEGTYIEHTDLRNALIALSSGGSIEDATAALAKLDWKNGGYSREEIGYAMDYVRLEAMQQVRMGEATESERLQRFGRVAQAIENTAYRNEIGEITDSIISAIDKEGNSYYILEGDITNPEAMLKAMDSEGKVVSLLASNMSGYSKASVADATAHYFKEMFSTEYNMERLAQVDSAVNRLINPPMDLLAQIAKSVGIVMPKEGDTITLVDGRTAKVTSVSDDLGIMAEMTDGEGNVSQVTIPIMQILSSNTYIAEAQKKMSAEDALELAQAEEAQMEAQDAAEENAEATSGMEEATTTEKVAEDGLIGTEVTLPNGTKGTIVEIDGDDVVVDTGRGVDAYEVYSREELGMTEATETTTPQPTQTTAEQTTSETATEQTTGEVTPEQATEALNEIAGIKPLPTLQDGSIDYDAIDDAETFAKHFEHDMGGREEAIEGVKDMREQAMADLAEAEKKGKKARSANDKVANKKLREQLAERIAFYDNVLDVYSQKAEAPAPTESVAEVDATPSTAEVAEVAETTPQTMEAETTATPQETETRMETAETTEEVAEEEALSAEEIWAAERREGYAVPNPKTGRNVGLVHNELSEQLEKKVRVLLNDVATAFGVNIVFQKQVKTKEGNNADGKIVGKTIYLSWGKRDNSLTWLTGHEFTHRMKSLAPEAYNRLRDAVRKFMGEKEWEFRIEEQRKKYEEATKKTEILSDVERVALHEEAIRQNTKEDGTYENKDVQETYDKLLAEARREAYIEEVVCDKVGDLVQDHNAFKQFVRSEKVRWDKKLLNWIREVLQSIKGVFNHRTHLFNEMMTELDNLIAEATAKTSKGANVDTHERVSASEASATSGAEAVERIESKGGVVDAQRGDVKYALSDVLTVPERESAIQDLMRVTGRSRATVQKYLKAEQSLARIIADDDNRAFLDLQVDESVPSIWNNSDYPQGTVEFSNICRKRLPLTMIYQQLQKEFPNTVFDASTLETIRGVLKENGIDVACGLCFVEDRRQLLGEIGNGFISALKGENVDVNEKQKEAIASLKDTYIPNLYELLTLDGMKALKKTHPEVANAFVAYNNARGMQAGRLFQAYSAYHREILGYSEARVNKINASGGLRIFSFSDFEAHHLIDLVQVLTDCARKGIKVQGYTKVPEFARAVKDTGMKLNRSLIAKGDGYVDADYTPKKNEAVSPNVVDGKRLLLDCVEGIDVNHKDFFDSSSSHNVGNILVGINDEQIRLAMVDPFIDYIIPFHSGLSEAIRKQKGIGNWQNYKLEQLEKKENGSGKLVNADKHGVNIYTEVLSDDIKTEKQFVERYLEVCKEKGWVPKFHRFLKKDKNGDFVYTKGYYKLLLDFKMFDSKGRILPQEVVQPIFDDAFNKEILEDYVKGEKAKMPNDEVYNKVKEALDLGGEKYSLITSEMDASYLDAVERGDMEAVGKAVTEAAKLTGYTEKVYHGTRNFGFTTFASGRPSGAIFTSDKPYVSANYAGDGKYASVRNINKGTKLVRNPQDVIDNARSVFNQEWRFATESDKNAVVERVEANAKRMRDEMLSRQVEMPEEMRDDVAWIENIIYDGAEARENGNEGNEFAAMLKRDYDLYKESKGNLRSNDSYEDLTPEQKDYLSFLIGYELGDVAVEIGLSYANAVSEGMMATIDGTSFVDINTLEDMTNETKHLGSYQLYGNLGANPLVIDAEGKEWFALDFNGMRTTDEITEWAKENGYSSVIFKDIYDYGDKSDVKVFFDSADLKSADPVTYDNNGNVIPLSERFNPEKEDIRYSMQVPSLLGVHNISLDKLRKVIKMGGLANPSVAVIDVDKQTHDDYGEYSLILPKNMVDARQGKNAGTWAGDAWTPTYPQVVRRMTDDKAISRFYKDIDALPEAIRNRVRLDFDSFMEGRSANALAYWYLFEKGNAPALVYIPSRYSEDITNAVEEATNGSFSMYGLTSEERAKCLDAYIAVKFDGDRAAFEEEMQARIDRLTETIETKKSDRVQKWAQDTIASIKEYGFDYDDVAKFIRDVGYDAREKGKVNVDATITAAREQIETNNLNSDYDAWRDNLDERYGIEEYIFDGYTNSGNSRYLPHTVENASKWMKKQGRQGAVATFPSFGTFVAVSIPKMTTLESIRKRKALLGKSKEEYDTFREKWENVYYELGKKLQPDAKSFDDYGYWRLIEAVGQKNPREFIKKQYGIELSEEDMAQLNEMLDAIRTEYPARYFETKFERPLQLSDFVAAVVPNDVPMDVYGRLSDANVEIFEYEKGDSNSRAEAMQKASAVENVRFSLQTFDAVTNYITFEARAFGITTPIFVVENAEEFKQALREIGVRNVDDYEKSAGIYDPKNGAIYIRADISDYERVFFEILLHENTHAVTQSILHKLKAIQNTLKEEDIFAYRDSKMSDIYKKYSALGVLNEIISYFVEKIQRDKLIDYYQGEQDIEDTILSDFDISLIEDELQQKLIFALRPVILENLEIQKRNYNERKGKAIVIARGYSGPYGGSNEKPTSSNSGSRELGETITRGRGEAQGGVLQKVGAQKDQSVAPTRYSLQSGDMPFFNDNGDIITFDNTDITGEDYDAVELRSPMPTTPRTTKDVIKAHLSARHNTAKERIRRESRVLRDAVRKQYREEQVRRREGVETMRTNASKVDYIIGAPIETLDYEAQVLAMIAMGTLSISWESLSKELGVKSGDKKSYRHITNGATATLDAVVHAWWESINGYENGIDTQDLRNALIDVLMQVPTAKGALSILEDRFDHALRNRDEALEDIDREEERLIAEEDARYNEQMTTLSDPARMNEYVRQYEQTVGFHEELTAIEGTLRKMDSELKAVRKRAERAQMRSRASKQKQSASFKEVREAIAESKRALLEALNTYEQLGFNKQEVRSLVDAVNKARSMADINKVRVKIENVILNVSIREKRRHMDQMLNLRLPSGELVETWVSKQIHDGKMSVADGKRILADMFRGTNANGVRVAKYIDDETARVMDYLRNNLVVPNHGGHYKEKKDADGNVIGREYIPSREAEMGADVLLKANNERCNELLGKAVEGTITEEEKIELQARQLYEPYLFVANARAYVKGVRAEGEKLYEDIQRKKAELGDAYTKEERDADYAALEANALHLVEAKTAYDDALTEYNETLSNVIMSGRDKLREFREAKEAHKAEVVGMAIRAIGGEARTIASQPTVAEKIAAWNRTTLHSTYWSFDSACREIDRFAPNGEGEFYKHFMGGMTKASNDFFTRTDNHIQDICDAVRRITGSKRDPRRALRAFMRKADMTTVGSITYKNNNGKMESLPLRISNALFTLAMWGQAQYREIMEKHGITQEQMEALKAKIEGIDGRYIDFMEWVIDSFLPSTRLEYNEVHKQLFGASMDNIENYFPAKVVEGYRDEDIAQVDTGLPSTMTGSIITRQKHNNMPKFDQSFFSVLLNHIQNMDQWASFSPLVEDLNAVISNPEFKRLVNTHMAGVNNDRTGKGSLWQIFKDTSAVAIGSYNCKTSDADSMISKLTGAWAASNISWRFSTALKQLSGLTAVAVSGLGKTQGMFLKNMMLSPLAVKWAMENSPMLKKRFGDRFAGNEALMRKYGQDQAKGLDLRKGKLKDGFERVNDFIRFLTVDVGMTPNAAVDALVVAITMKTVYDVELSNLTKGKPESATEEQKSYAMMKAEIFANETQQSAEGAYLSVPQAQRSVATAVMTTYLNASFASHRLRVQGVQDIYRWLSPKYRKEIDDRYGKGAARKAAGKGFARLLAGLSIDATFILMSRAVGQGLWRLIIDWFDDTEDDDDEADPIDWSDIGWEIGFQTAFGGILGGNIITSLRNGFQPAGVPALEELKKLGYDLLGWTEAKIKKGDWSIDLNFWALGEIIFKYGYGLDPETMLNIARGIEGICRDKDPMAAMKILNTPQSMVNIIAGPRRNNETVKENVERIARLEVLFAEPKFSELYDDELNYIGGDKYTGVGGAKKYRLKSLAKDYNKRQRAAVMSKYLSPSEVAEFERIDREYKKAVEPLGWEVGKNPQDDKVDKTGWRNIYPEGLRQEHYAALKGIATAAEQTRRAQDRWVGSDQGYADLVREEYNLREQLIAGRRSPYKAKTAKEKIDREKKANKKNKSQKK